ncbi:MAG: DUF1254 domain-containing protein [Myxococcales bacterium]
MARNTTFIILLALLASQACKSAGSEPSARSADEAKHEVTPDDATAIAEEAYIYAYPMMESYRTLYVQAIDRTGPGYRGPFNELTHERELLGPQFEDIVRPNNDTLYSMAWLDLRAQPIVLSVPAVEDRYYSVQLIDMFTHNFAYIGTRTTGTAAGRYVIAGPGWKDSKPDGTDAVLRSESHFVYCIIRTEVRGPGDLSAVAALQDRYRLTPLNVFLGYSNAPAAPGITFPSYVARKVQSAAFIDLFDFLLTQVVVVPRERELMERFALIGIEPGALSASLSLSPELRHAIDAGVGQGIMAITNAAQHPESVAGVIVRSKGGWSGIDGLFGNGESMRGKYLARAVAAMVGLYGNDFEEAYYPMADADESGEPLDGSQHRYVIHFERNQIPPVNGFWSLTMYGLPDQLMVENPIHRYSIGDRSDLRYGADGSLTIYVQHGAPGSSERSNWLPAPDGPFSLQLRMYLPKSEASDPLYLPPPVRAVR